MLGLITSLWLLSFPMGVLGFFFLGILAWMQKKCCYQPGRISPLMCLRCPIMEARPRAASLLLTRSPPGAPSAPWAFAILLPSPIPAFSNVFRKRAVLYI